MERSTLDCIYQQSQLKILYLLFSDWFGTQRSSIWCSINGKIINTTQIWFNLTRFRIVFSVLGNSRLVYRPRLVKLQQKKNFRLSFFFFWRLSELWGWVEGLNYIHDSTIVSRDLRGALNWAPIMPRDASLCDSGCIFFPDCSVARLSPDLEPFADDMSNTQQHAGTCRNIHAVTRRNMLRVDCW